jgi:1,4-alpha-glucan branching enzyme
MTASDGDLALVLHAHLPYVRHPEHDSFLEEDWLYEAITETYIPLLQGLEALAADALPVRVTLSISPPLLHMLSDELLHERYRAYLARLERLAQKERARNAGDGHLGYLARHYAERFEATAATWDRLDGNLVGAFADLQRRGLLDLMTSAATHGYLPLMQASPAAVRAQVRVGVEQHTRMVGQAPQGIWLPECGYFPGLDRQLSAAGLRYFVGDTHAVLLARPRPSQGSLAPVYCTGSGVAVFGRDVESSRQVWSRATGYPGDPVYREFYRDIGYDLDLDYIRPFVQPTGERKSTGIKYHRITGATDHKQLYDPYWAHRRAEEHAADFVGHRRRQLQALPPGGGPGGPIVVCPYDAELFGHWWYEGPWWLEATLRQAAEGGPRLNHLRGYLEQNPTQQVCTPAQSSWGEGGFHAYWLNPRTEWIYPHLQMAAARMEALARIHPDADGLRRRALNQAARELLLAQSSDWAFIISTGTMVDYAVQRTRNHLRRFTRLHDELRGGSIDEGWLARLEYIDNIFPEIDYGIYGEQA